MNTKLRYIAAFFAVTLALVWCIPSIGQVIKGSISGSVTDPQGAVVSGAQVKAKNIETGVVFPTTSDSAGLYRLNLLPVGTYNVEIAAPGFKTTQQTGVVVGTGRDSGLGVTHMSIGEASTTVEVSAEAPLIETTQSQISSTFSGQTLSTFAGIQENQGLDRLALFVPGVVATRSDNFSNTNGGGFSSNGLRGRNNDQEIDGQNNNDNSVGGPGLFVSDTNFVQQYVIITNNFGPEYGRNAGSVVNVITKSGTNAWHGSVFGTENNSWLNAMSNTLRQTKNADGTPKFNDIPRTNEEFSGGTIGGPILKNKWFLFSGFDSDLFAGFNSVTSSTVSPTSAGLATLAGCFPASQTLGILQKFGPYAFSGGNPTAGNVSARTFGSCTGVQVGTVTRTPTTPFHGFDFVNRVDGQFGNDTFMGRYLFNRGNNFNSGDNTPGGWVLNVTALSQAVLFSETHNFTSHMVNEARIGFNRLNVDFGGNNLGNPGEPVAGQLLNAFTNISFQTGNILGIGPATNLPQARIVNDWQAQDNWNFVKGRHSFKGGVNWTYQRSPNIFLPNVNGQYRFANLQTFLSTGVPNRVTIAQGNPVLDFREYDTFLYGGDDWKISQNLTLNLGLTWTYYGNPENLFNDFTTKRESTAGQNLWRPDLPLSIRTNPQIPSIKNSFGPSIGFAYSPQWGGFITGHGKTVFRGGYRMLYDPPFYNIFLNISTAAPYSFLQTVTNPVTVIPSVPFGPAVRTALASVIPPGVLDPRNLLETDVSPNFGPDKVHTWSLGFERELTKNAVWETRYVGNHGVNLFQTVDGNPFIADLKAAFPSLVPSNLTPCPAANAFAAVAVGRVDCNRGIVRTRNNGGFSDYHGVQTEFRASNLFKQLTIRTGYTFSKNLDNVSEIFATNSAGNTTFAAQNPVGTGGPERSISGLNITHAFTVAATEYVPFFKEQHGLIGHILGGWAVSGSYVYGSGQPYTATQGLLGAIANVTQASLAGHNFYDSGYVGGFLGGIDAARPFYGNRNAPIDSVGIMAGDSCLFLGIGCALPATQLISVNAWGAAGNSATPAQPGCLRGAPACPVVPITSNDVRYIINARTSAGFFGTPFGNVPRNDAVDAPSNRLDASIFKNLKLGERSNFEMRLSATNALNHFNFASVVPFVEDAGVKGFLGAGFANPSVTGANGRVVTVSGRFTF